jgi:hypothetical protein
VVVVVGMKSVSEKGRGECDKELTAEGIKI